MRRWQRHRPYLGQHRAPGQSSQLRTKERQTLDVVVYAPEDQAYLEELLPYLPGVRALLIQDACFLLATMPIRYVLLLMSIKLLYRLLGEAEYDNLYRRLKLYEREGIILVIATRSCQWQESFFAPTFPKPGARKPTLQHLRSRERQALYRTIARYVVL